MSSSKFSEENWTTVRRSGAGAGDAAGGAYKPPALQHAPSRISGFENAFQRQEREEREREEAEKKKRQQDAELNDFNFPSLTNSFDTGKSMFAGGPKSYAEMAKDWKEKAEQMKKMEEQLEFEREYKRQQRQLLSPPVPTYSSHQFGTQQFGSYHSSAGDTYEEEPEFTPRDDEWTTVERKQRRPKQALVPTLPARFEDEEDSEWNAELADRD